MATVTVFVDDAVLGRLPPVCVKHGTWTDDRLTFTQDVGGRTGLGVAWLLVLAGPLGWIGLFMIAATRQNTELLTVTLPYSESAHIRLTQRQRDAVQGHGGHDRRLCGSLRGTPFSDNRFEAAGRTPWPSWPWGP